MSRRSFWDLIYQMSGQGITVFVTTHYMDEADYCDRLGLIYRGKLIAEGTPLEMKQTHMKRDVYEIEVSDLVGAMEALGREGIESSVFGSLLHTTAEKGLDAAGQITKILERQGIVAIRIEKVLPSLEDVFVSLIEVS